MCGICGFTSKIVDQKKHIEQMLSPLKSRGPDAEGTFLSDEISLGHTRLSIIDLYDRSNQPLKDKVSGNIIVFNGEIYNFKYIKSELIDKFNCKFDTQSDTEVILKSYTYYGLECFNKLEGMFALAIWDSVQQRLVLARDRFGEKPLFYSSFNNNGKKQISFSSNLNSLKFSPNFNHKINTKSLKSYLINNYVNNQETFYEGSFNVDPGSFYIFEKNQLVKKKYFNIHEFYKKKEKYKKFNKGEFNEVLNNSIKSRLISDVDVGIFLSGGLDSSIIASIAKKYNENIKTFTLGFEEKTYDESDKAKIVSEHLKIRNQKFLLNDKDLLEIDKIVLSFGEPMSDTSIIPTYFLSKYTKQNVKVCLTGDGGDELFFGYDTYTASKVFELIKKYNLNFIFNKISKLSNFIPQRKTKINIFYAIKKFLEAFKNKDEYFFVHEFWRQINDNSSLKKILNKNFNNDLIDIKTQKYNFKDTVIDNNSHNNLCDFQYFLERDILVKSDRCSMANSLELRSPFLSYDLFKYISNLDPHEKFHAFNKKNILKTSAFNHLPKSIVNQKKRGFNSPVSYWFNGVFNEMFLDLLKTDKTKTIFNIQSIENLLIENKNNKFDNGNVLFNIFCLLIWINNNKFNL